MRYIVLKGIGYNISHIVCDFSVAKCCFSGSFLDVNTEYQLLVTFKYLHIV